jgi:hypothetical protein
VRLYGKEARYIVSLVMTSLEWLPIRDTFRAQYGVFPTQLLALVATGSDTTQLASIDLPPKP